MGRCDAQTVQIGQGDTDPVYTRGTQILPLERGMAPFGLNKIGLPESHPSKPAVYPQAFPQAAVIEAYPIQLGFTQRQIIHHAVLKKHIAERRLLRCQPGQVAVAEAYPLQRRAAQGQIA